MSGSKGKKLDLTELPKDDSDLDEGAPALDGDGDQVTVDKKYIQKLRQEAAQRRVQARQFLDVFSNYNESEVAWMLDTAGMLITDPMAAVARYRELVNIYDPDSNTKPTEEHPKTKKDDTKPEEDLKLSGDKDNGKELQLDKATLEEMLAKHKEDIEVQARSRELRKAAEAKGYGEDHPGLDQFLAFVRKNQGDIDAADKAYREFVDSESGRLAKEKSDLNEQFPGRGRGQGPVIPQHEPPKNFEEARQQAEAFFDVAIGQ